MDGLTIVVPVYNEEKHIQDVFESNIIPECCKVKYLIKREYWDRKNQEKIGKEHFKTGEKKQCYDLLAELSEKYNVSEHTVRHYVYTCKNINIGTQVDEQIIKRKGKDKKKG